MPTRLPLDDTSVCDSPSRVPRDFPEMAVGILKGSGVASSKPCAVSDQRARSFRPPHHSIDLVFRAERLRLSHCRGRSYARSS
jgi:hypothetical protein